MYGGMKIFSNFDTDMPDRLYKKAIEKYGKENVIFIRRDKIYLVLKVYIWVIVWLLFFAFCLRLMYIKYDSPTLNTTMWIFLVLTFLLLKWKALSKIIDYHLDFTIVSRNHVTSYDQSGIFHRSTRSLDLAKVKSVNIKKE